MQSNFRGWWIVAVAFLAQAITIGLTIIPFGLFVTPLVDEFGATVSQVQLGLAVLTLVMTSVGPLVGRVLDGHSIRVVMASGSLLMAACFAAMSVARELWQLGALFGVGVAAAISMAGPLPATTVIAKWFDRRRGRAMGFAAMGPPAGGLILVPLAGWLLEEFGWRSTLRVFAGVAALIAPLALLLVRNSPQEIGQQVDGGGPEEDAAPETPAGAEWSTAALLRSQNFWAVALGVGIVFGLSGGWNANAPRFGEDLGFSGSHMAMLIGLSAGLGMPATLLFGMLADRLDNRALLLAVVAIQGAALALLATEPTDPLFTTAFLLLGLSGGGLLPLYASLIGRLFGAASFGSVMGLGGIVMLPFGFAAPIAAGAVRDATGSYVGALFGFAGCFVVALLVLTMVRRPERERAPV